MPAYKLRGGMHHNISTMLDRTNQIRSTEGIVDNQRDFMTMGNLGNGVNINDIGIRISQCLDKDGFRIFPDSFLEVGQITRINKSGRDTVSR